MWLILTAYKRWISCIILLLSLPSCQQKSTEDHRFSGYALGTSYNIHYVSTIKPQIIQKGIDSLLNVINQSMSTYIIDSDISKINRGDSTVIVDDHFKKVFNKATEIWKASEGYFDPTVGALVNAYGFGPENRLPAITQNQKDSLLKLTGWHKVQLLPSGTIQKTTPNIYIDFNALAKGYTVDLIGIYLSDYGMKDFMVEIGGEIVAQGNSPNTGNSWKIAIDDPLQQIDRKFITTQTLKNQALATSGNYRKYRIESSTGQRFVHSVNPKTGNAFRSKVLSASVIAPDCMTADAWATALMVMPLNESVTKIKDRFGIEAFWVVADEQDGIEEIYSEKWN